MFRIFGAMPNKNLVYEYVSSNGALKVTLCQVDSNAALPALIRTRFRDANHLCIQGQALKIYDQKFINSNCWSKGLNNLYVSETPKQMAENVVNCIQDESFGGANVFCLVEGSMFGACLSKIKNALRDAGYSGRFQRLNIADFNPEVDDNEIYYKKVLHQDDSELHHIDPSLTPGVVAELIPGDADADTAVVAQEVSQTNVASPEWWNCPLVLYHPEKALVEASAHVAVDEGNNEENNCIIC